MKTYTKEEIEAAYKKGFSDGYDAGFTCAEIAATSTITEAQNQYDQATQAPANITSNPAGAPGPHPVFIPILDSIINTYKSKP